MVNTVEPQGELIICFDENGNEIEPHTRQEVHSIPLKYWHGVTGVVVVNSAGQILCSKRSENLSQRPGRWQSNFGGHVNFGQSFETNAVRELFEESGIEKKESELHFIEESKNEEYKHFVKHYVCLYEGNLEDLNFPDGEITEVKWMGMEEAWEAKLKNPELWAGYCSPERQKKINDWLKNKIYA